ncbi:TRAP-type C4-dicarboxylate transport system, substrate-binding protein [Palleronia salina]|uniref:TRAP-type C4-dicarboxylate transport system, substrate-binding protein n=1 Tax=Palleronia salina TaxID=313368 RepID=A0A1M6K3Z5_9RHOB|nr:TRAP transporter substrate-binding protein [Palleronia salina]SHJ53664.1 TRAP-type C4-dicarboxylate transport system, substrate-binding protein [Palleronia salina]
MSRLATFLAGTSSTLAALALSTGAQAQDFTFSIHHFLSPAAPTQTVLLEPWVQSVEEASDGRIQFEIFPAMSLGGAPPELYSQVRDGVADLVWTLPGYTPGTFPRTEVFELPSVHVGDARATNLAIQDMMDDLAADFEDVHPILVHVHSGNALHLANGMVESAADFEGLKVRSPSRTGAWVLEALGAEPVGMPVPALPQALSKNTVDAGLVPFEVAIPLGLAELTSASVELNEGARFGTSTFLFAMNKDAYESLPDDLKQVIDDHSGAALAAEMGTAWNEIEPVGKQMARDAGNSVVALDAEATAAFEEPFAAVAQRWVDEATGQGIDAAALLEKAKAAVAEHSE